ncbi:MAG: DMT family transporter [Cytophagaceae bacterium]
MQNRSKGINYMLASMVLFSLMHASVRYVKDIPLAQVIFFRVSISFIIAFGILFKQNVNFRGKNQKLLIVRGSLGALSLFGFFYTLQQIPLATAVTLSHVAPFFIALLGAIILHERINKLTWLLFPLSLVGVAMIKGFDHRITLFDTIIAISAALFSALAHFSVRLNKNDHPLLVVFYLPLMTIPIALPIMIYQWVEPEWHEWLVLIIMGLLSHYAQYFLTKAYQAEEAGILAPIYYVGVIFALALGYFLFGETFNLQTFAGMGLIVLSTLVHIIVSRK